MHDTYGYIVVMGKGKDFYAPSGAESNGWRYDLGSLYPKLCGSREVTTTALVYLLILLALR